MQEKIIQTNNWDTKKQTKVNITNVYNSVCKKLNIKEFSELSYDDTKKALKIILDAYPKEITVKELGGLADCLLSETNLANDDNDEYLDIVNRLSDVGFDQDTLPEAVPEVIKRANDYLAK